jgi:hypothetical protein
MRRLTADEEERLAEQGQKYLADIRGLGRPLALRTAPRLTPPPPTAFADGKYNVLLDTEWLEHYGHQTRVALDASFTDAEAFYLVRNDRRLAPFLRFRIEKKLTQLARSVEPREQKTLHQFFVTLAAAFAPGKGNRSDWDRARVRPLVEERRRLLMAYQQEFRRTGKLPPAAALPVFDRVTIEDGHSYVERVTIDRAGWPIEATRAFLDAFLDAKKPRTLERYASTPRRRPRKPRRRR